MNTQAFDLNDIVHEPTDEQLSTLMRFVAVEAQTRATQAQEALMQKLRKEIAEAAKRRAFAAAVASQ